MSLEVGVERPTSLPLDTSQQKRHVHFCEAAAPPQGPTSTSPRKPRPDPDFKPRRRRFCSASFLGDGRFGYKRRKPNMVLPTRFLLGGNISDPLNLGSLDGTEESDESKDEGSTSSSAAAHRRSNAVRVIIPPNINDPLNLDAASDGDNPIQSIIQRQKRRRRYRKRRRRNSEPGGVSGERVQVDEALLQQWSEVMTPGSDVVFPAVQPLSPTVTFPASTTTDPPALPTTLRIDIPQPSTSEACSDSNTATATSTPANQAGSTKGISPCQTNRACGKRARSKSDNKIVSPVIPQPGGERKRHLTHSRHSIDKPQTCQQNTQYPKKVNPKNEQFRYGNYSRYYGYRNPDHMQDPRLGCLKPDWFDGKAVLDIGCNIGHIILTIARDYNPKKAVGIDIDRKLVNIAQKNIKHYMHQGTTEEAQFPKSMRLLYGPLKPTFKCDGSRTFPYNIKFYQSNYVLESDELLETVRPEFDAILCLSVTKWVHLNWGDVGLKRFFQRMFLNLHPGGKLILEPQAWPSYSRRRKLTEEILNNYKSIRLFPDQFEEFLLKDVGFASCERLTTPIHFSRGFQRPIFVYTKGASTSVDSTTGRMTATGSLEHGGSSNTDAATPQAETSVPGDRTTSHPVQESFGCHSLSTKTSCACVAESKTQDAHHMQLCVMEPKNPSDKVTLGIDMIDGEFEIKCGVYSEESSDCSSKLQTVNRPTEITSQDSEKCDSGKYVRGAMNEARPVTVGKARTEVTLQTVLSSSEVSRNDEDKPCGPIQVVTCKESGKVLGTVAAEHTGVNCQCTAADNKLVLTENSTLMQSASKCQCPSSHSENGREHSESTSGSTGKHRECD